MSEHNVDAILAKESGEQFFNTSKYDFSRLLGAPDDVADSLRHYVAGFSTVARDVLEKFDFDRQITRLDRAGLLYPVVSTFAGIDLHRDVVSDSEMGYLYEELIRQSTEISKETAGEHFTPREVIRLMVSLLFMEDEDLLAEPGIVKSILDPACGTGGMLAVAEERLRVLNPVAHLHVFGQEINAETYAICRSNVMLRGQDGSGVVLGDSFTHDAHEHLKVDYLISQPPFGLAWKAVSSRVKDEAVEKGFAGRFGAGLPRTSDGSLLFLQHMISKMKPATDGGSRIAIVLSSAPLFSGGAGSGESEIRRWIIENDWLEAVVSLPDQLFYNTGISTYCWILSNRKAPHRRGKVQLIDARDMYEKLRKSLGSKRKETSQRDIDEVRRLYNAFTEGDRSRIFDNQAFATPSGDRGVAPDEDGPPAVQDPQRVRYAIEPWMFAAGIGPETHRRLADIAILSRARRIAGEAEPLLTAADLARSDLLVGALESVAREGVPYTVCTGGDIVGRGRSWAVLHQGFGTALTQLDVVRLSDEHGGFAALMCEWLESEDAASQIGAGAVPRLRGELMVPARLLENSELRTAASDLRAARQEAQRLVDSLFDDPFTSSAPTESERTAQMIEMANRAVAMTKLLEPLRDVVQRAEWSYPHQVADLARQYRLQTTSDRQLQVGLRLAEALVRQFGVLAAASIVSRDPDPEGEVFEKFRGGISSGNWMRIVQDAQSAGVLGELPDLEAMSFRKRGVGALLGQAINIRNRAAHGHGVITSVEAASLVRELEPILVSVLDESVWLGTLQHLYVKSCQYRDEHIGMEIECDLLSGAHPVWEPRTLAVVEPVVPKRVVVVLPGSAMPLPLHPFMSVAVCHECRRDEAYVLDRVDDAGRGKARSIRDHESEVTF